MGLILAAAGPWLVITIGMLLGQSSAPSENEDEMENPSLFSKPGLKFIISPRQSYAELAFCSTVTLLFGALTYAILVADGKFTFSSNTLILLCLQAFSGFSLFSRQCPELSIYTDNDNEF